MLKKAVLKCIGFYQDTISPDHSHFGKDRHPYGYCQFSPSCSQYSYEAIDKYGIFKGGWLSFKRIIRCNPWSKGGIDNLK